MGKKTERCTMKRWMQTGVPVAKTNQHTPSDINGRPKGPSRTQAGVIADVAPLSGELNVEGSGSLENQERVPLPLPPCPAPPFSPGRSPRIRSRGNDTQAAAIKLMTRCNSFQAIGL